MLNFRGRFEGQVCVVCQSMPIISRSFGGTVPAHAARRSRKDGVGEILSKFPTLDARRHRGAWYGFCAHPAPAASFAAMEHVNPLVTVFVLGIIVAEAAQAKTFLPWRRSTTRRGRSWMQCSMQGKQGVWRSRSLARFWPSARLGGFTGTPRIAGWGKQIWRCHDPTPRGPEAVLGPGVLGGHCRSRALAHLGGRDSRGCCCSSLDL